MNWVQAMPIFASLLLPHTLPPQTQLIGAAPDRPPVERVEDELSDSTAAVPPAFNVSTIPVGRRPTDARISPDERWAYVLSGPSNEIDVIDLALRRLAYRLALPYFPSSIALSRTGHELYIGATTPPFSLPIDDDVCNFGFSVTSTQVLVVDTATMTITKTIAVPSGGLVNTLVLSPDGTLMAAVADKEVVLIDTTTHAAQSLPAIANEPMYSGVFAQGQAKLFVGLLGTTKKTVFDLVARTAHVLNLLPGYSTGGATLQTNPARDKVFFNACNPFCAMAVVDAASESLLGIVDASSVGGVLVRRDGVEAFLPWNAGVVDLNTLRRIADLEYGGVSGALSPGETILYLRNFGCVEGSSCYYGQPGKYDLMAIDTSTRRYTAYTVLDPGSSKCSMPSPLRLSESGRLIVAPNPNVDTVSIVTVDTTECVEGPTALCLGGGRFKVTATFDAGGGNAGTAKSVRLTPDTGYLWFFSSSNVEAVVKVLDACSFNDRFWVFAGGLTDVNVVLTLTDTKTGATKSYTNPAHTKFQPIQDTSAFATCDSSARGEASGGRETEQSAATPVGATVATSETSSAASQGESAAGSCTPSPTALCLNSGRFQVTATFDTGNGNSGIAKAVQLTPDTGYLWFFSSSNVEAVIKVLDACSFNDRFWVFAGGLTDVNVVITVTDTATGTTKAYTNPLHSKFQPIQDTSAFATCP